MTDQPDSGNNEVTEHSKKQQTINNPQQLPLNPLAQGIVLQEWANAKEGQGQGQGQEQGQLGLLGVQGQGQQWPALMQGQQWPFLQQVASQGQGQGQQQQQQNLLQPYAWTQMPQYPFIIQAVLQAQAQVQQALGAMSQPQNPAKLFNFYQNQAGGLYAAGTPVNTVEGEQVQLKIEQQDQCVDMGQQDKSQEQQAVEAVEKINQMDVSQFEQDKAQGIKGQDMQPQDGGSILHLQPILNAPIEQQQQQGGQIGVTPQQFAEMWKQQAAAAAAAGIPQNIPPPPFEQKPPVVTGDERVAKRQKRKQSNRESARRSRQRKQEEVKKLGLDMQQLSVENQSLTMQVNELQDMLNTILQEREKLIERVKSLGGTIDDIQLDSLPPPLTPLPLLQSQTPSTDQTTQRELRPLVPQQDQPQQLLLFPMPTQSLGQLTLEQQAILQSMQMRGIPRSVTVENISNVQYQPTITSTDSPLPPGLANPGQAAQLSSFLGATQVTSGAIAPLPQEDDEMEEMEPEEMESKGNDNDNNLDD